MDGEDKFTCGQCYICKLKDERDTLQKAVEARNAEVTFLAREKLRLEQRIEMLTHYAGILERGQ